MYGLSTVTTQIEFSTVERNLSALAAMSSTQRLAAVAQHAGESYEGAKILCSLEQVERGLQWIAGDFGQALQYHRRIRRVRGSHRGCGQARSDLAKRKLPKGVGSIDAQKGPLPVSQAARFMASDTRFRLSRDADAAVRGRSYRRRRATLSLPG